MVLASLRPVLDFRHINSWFLLNNSARHQYEKMYKA